MTSSDAAFSGYVCTICKNSQEYFSYDAHVNQAPYHNQIILKAIIYSMFKK